MSTSKRNGASACGSDTELSKDQKLATSEAEIARLQTALNAKPSSPELLLEDPDADAHMLDGSGGYGAPNADARTLGGGGGCGGGVCYGGGAWDVDSSQKLATSEAETNGGGAWDVDSSQKLATSEAVRRRRVGRRFISEAGDKRSRRHRRSRRRRRVCARLHLGRRRILGPLEDVGILGGTNGRWNSGCH